jgi:hypothetical protein
MNLLFGNQPPLGKDVGLASIDWCARVQYICVYAYI